LNRKCNFNCAKDVLQETLKVTLLWDGLRFKYNIYSALFCKLSYPSPFDEEIGSRSFAYLSFQE